MKKSIIQKALETLGLTENEAVLYHTMIKHPQATVRDLQSITPFPRTQLYHILDGLKSHGLVTGTKKRARTRYIAEDPEQLQTLLKKREELFQTNANTIKGLIPKLKNQYRSSQVGGYFQTFVGVENYREAYEDILHTRPNNVYTFAHTGEIPLSGVDIRADIRKKMKEIGIEEKISKKMDMKDMELHLYAGKILYTSMNDAEPVATLIEDKNLYIMQRNMFGVLAE